jgi:hypothetical protein
MSNFISITADTQESTGGNYYQVTKEEDFIVENVIAKELKYDSVNGSDYFEIIASTKDGREIKSGYQFIPNKEKATSDEAFAKSVSMRQGLLTNFLRRFKGDQAVLQATTWKEAVEKIQADCAPHYSSTPLRAKVALNKSSKDAKYYTNLSVFAPFENMTTPREQTRHIVTNRDKLDLANKNREDAVTPDSDVAAKTVDASTADTF